jgi:transposase
MRKRYTWKFKAEIVQEVLREPKTIAETASEHGVHPNQVYLWIELVLKGLAGLFSDDTKAPRAAEAEQAKQLEELYAEISGA